VGARQREARTWTDADRVEARRLQGEGLSQSQIAERVCGDRTYRSTVQLWLRAADATSTPQRPKLTRIGARATMPPSGLQLR
jgi:hypothetical protein